MIELPTTSAAYQLVPGHVLVDRCSGSCHASPSAHSCTPTKTENVTIEVMAVSTTYSSGAWATTCTTVTVEKHLSCSCGCGIQPSDCDASLHNYDAANCKCECRNASAAKAVCLATPGKTWNSQRCRCECRELSGVCSTGFVYDNVESCGCVRIASVASVASNAVMLGVVLAVGLVFLGLVLFELRRRDNVRHKRRLSQKRKEAFDLETFDGETEQLQSNQQSIIKSKTSDSGSPEG